MRKLLKALLPDQILFKTLPKVTFFGIYSFDCAPKHVELYFCGFLVEASKTANRAIFVAHVTIDQKQDGTNAELKMNISTDIESC